jgi:hypothetical protein
LDLFVVNYAKWTPDSERFCGDRQRNMRVYCYPEYFEGKLRLSWWESRSPIARAASMRAEFRDYNNDGFPDISFTALVSPLSSRSRSGKWPIFCGAMNRNSSLHELWVTPTAQISAW